MLRKLILASLLLLATAVAVVLVAPSLIDWTRYRPEIAARLGELFGRPVTIGGRLDFALLPQPVMTAGDVTIADAVGDTLATIRTAELRLSWLPLLAGRVELERLVLDQPEITFAIDGEGARNWQAPPVAAPAPGTPSPWLDWLGQASFRLISIQDGSLHYQDARDGRAETLTGLSADLSSTGPRGAHDLNGQLSWRGRPLRLLARTSPAGAGQWQVYLNLGLVGSQSALTLTGGHYLSQSGELTGVLRIQGAKPAELARLLVGETATLPRPLGETLNMSARIALNEQRLLLDQLKLQLGQGERGQGLAGRLTARFEPAPGLDFNGRMDRLALSDWLPEGRAGLADAAALLPQLFARLPGGLDLELAVQRVGIGDATLSNLALTARGTAAEGALERLSFTGPDRLSASLDGSWNEAKGLDIGFDVSGERLESTLALAGLPVPDGLAPDVRGGFAGASRLTRKDAVTAIALEQATLARQTLTGQGSWQSGARPALAVTLRGKTLDLDKIWPPLSPLPFDPAAGLAADPGIDLSLDIAADTLTARGLTAQSVVLTGRTVEGALALDRLSFTGADGLDLSLAGTAKTLYPPAGLDFTGKMTLAALPPWVTRLGGLPESWHARIGAVTAGLSLKSDVLTLDVGGGEARLQYSGTLPLDAAAPIDGTLRLTHPELTRLIAMAADLPDARRVKPLGPLDIFAKLSGPRGNLALSDIRAKLAGGQFQGGGGLSFAARPVLALDLQGDGLALDPLLSPLAEAPGNARWSAAPLELDWLRRIDGRLGLTLGKITLDGWTAADAALNLTLVDGALTLVQGDGTLAGGRLGLRGSLAIPTEIDKPYAGTLALRLVGAKAEEVLPDAGAMKPQKGALSLELDLSANGRSPATLVSTLGGSGRVHLNDATLAGIDLPALSALYKDGAKPGPDRLRKPFTGGQTPALTCDGTLSLNGGVLTIRDARWQGPAGVMISNGTHDLNTGALDLSTAVTPNLAPAALGMRLKGPRERPDRLLDLKPAEPPAAAAGG